MKRTKFLGEDEIAALFWGALFGMLLAVVGLTYADPYRFYGHDDLGILPDVGLLIWQLTAFKILVGVPVFFALLFLLSVELWHFRKGLFK